MKLNFVTQEVLIDFDKENYISSEDEEEFDENVD